MNGWVLITHCHDANMAPLVQGGLESQGIPSVVNKVIELRRMCFATACRDLGAESMPRQRKL